MAQRSKFWCRSKAQQNFGNRKSWWQTEGLTEGVPKKGNENMKTKKLLSILLALMMILSVVPFYASAEAIALTADNVVAWPTTSGEIYFGQKLSDGITLNSENALVTSDGTETGTVIPGKWEFIDKDFAPTAWGKTSKANVKFTPENTDEYIGFEVTKSANVTYVVNKTTPVFVDEINDPIVATDVEQEQSSQHQRFPADR